MASISNGGVYWKRKGYVEIEMSDGSWRRFGNEENALDFRFHCAIPSGTMCPKFTVGILGLSKEHINALTVWQMAKAAKSLSTNGKGRYRRIKVYAGYAKDNIANPLLDGCIIRAMPTQPPEMWLNFECLHISSRYNVTDQVKSSIKNKSLYYIAKSLAKLINLDSVLWQSERVQKSRKASFLLQSTPLIMIDEFAHRFNLSIGYSGGMMVVMDRHPEQGRIYNATVLSADTGMIGVPRVNEVGADVKMRLNNSIRQFSWVYLKSELLPSANGYYYVISRQISGQLRGHDWTSSLKLIREKKR